MNPLLVGAVVASLLSAYLSLARADPVALLSGEWQGTAEHSRIGSIAYDLNFQEDGEGCVSAAAVTRASTHYWRICERDGQWHIRFLSTFGGNETPIHFVQVSKEDGVRSFFAKTHRFMELLLDIGLDSTEIRVLHHGRLHVSIHLVRAANVSLLSRQRASAGHSGGSRNPVDD